MTGYVLTFAAGVAGGIILEKALAKMTASSILERSDALRACFGEPMCTTTLSFDEVTEWIKERKDLLSDGSKAIVVKATNEALKNLGKEINVTGVDNYLIIAVVSNTSDIQDSILIKYEKLEQELENVLAKGNGSLVVEG